MEEILAHSADHFEDNGAQRLLPKMEPAAPAYHDEVRKRFPLKKTK